MNVRGRNLLLLILALVAFVAAVLVLYHKSKGPKDREVSRTVEGTRDGQAKGISESGIGDAEDDAKRGVTVSGKVKVPVEEHDRPEWGDLSVEMRRLGGRPGIVLRESMDAAGEFTFRDVRKGQYSICVLPCGEWSSLSRNIRVEERDVTDVDIALQKRTGLLGIVTDNLLRPLEGVEVFICERPVPIYSPALFDKGISRGMGKRIKSDKEGKFRSDSGSVFHVVVRKETYALLDYRSWDFRYYRAGNSSVGPITVMLPPEARITGRAESASGSPVPHALIMVRWDSTAGKYVENHDYCPAIFAVLTDETGGFRIDSLREGSYELYVQDSTESLGALARFTVSAGKTEKLGTVKLIPLRTISGITVTENGMPVGNARISADADGRERWWLCPAKDRSGFWPSAISERTFPTPEGARSIIESDEAGRFLFKDLPCQGLVIHAVNNEWDRATTTVDTDLDADAKLVFKAPYSELITVKVIDGASGKAVEGAKIILLPEKHSASLMKEALSGPDGISRIEVREEAPWGIVASDQGRVSEVAFFEPGNAASRYVELRLLASPSLGITVSAKETGAPLSEARIRASWGSSDEKYYVAGRLRKILIDRQARTGAEGHAQITEIPKGKHELWAECPGFVSLRKTIHMDEGHQEIRFELERKAVIRGSVTDAGGRPVAGAKLFLEYAILEPSLNSPDASTNEEGLFLIDGDYDSQYVLYAEHPLHAIGKTDPFELKAGMTMDNVAIILLRGGSISGQVVDAEGMPVGSAGVKCRIVKEKAEKHSRDFITCGFIMGRMKGDGTDRNCSTDADGFYSLPHLEPGSYTVTVFQDGYCDTAQGDVVVKNGLKTDNVNFVLEIGETLVGTVVNSRNEQIEGVRVIVNLRTTLTTEDGAFEVRGLPEGHYRITLLKEGHTEVEEEIRIPSPPVKYVMKDDSAIIGKVVDASSGVPLGYLSVTIRSDRNEFNDDTPGREMSTSLGTENGLFRIGHLEAGIVSVTLDGRGYAPKTLPNVSIEEGKVTDLGTIELGRGGELRIKVVSEDKGTPLQGARVAFIHKFRSRWEFIHLEGEETNALGECVFKNVGQGDKTLRVLYGSYIKKIVTIKTAGSGKESITIPISTGLSLSGRVISKDDDNPISKADVRLTFNGPTLHQAMPSPTALTEGNGSFRFDNLAPGAYLVEVEHKDFASASQEVHLSREEQTVTFVLPKGGSLSIRVRNEEGGPLGGCEVWVRDKGYAVHHLERTNEDGECSFTNLPGRAYEVSVDRKPQNFLSSFLNNQTLTRAVELVEGQTAELQFHFKKGYRIYGKVTKNGEPMPHVGVSVSSLRSTISEIHAVGFSETNENGEYRIESPPLPPGKYNVGVYQSDKQNSIYQDKQIEIVDGDVEANVAFSAGSISGRVTDASGKPLANVEVYIGKAEKGGSRSSYDLGELAGTTKTDENGTYIVRNVGKGTFDVRGTMSGYSSAYRTLLKGEEEDVTGIDLVLQTAAALSGSVQTEDGLEIEIMKILIVNETGRVVRSREVMLNDGSYSLGGLPRGSLEIIASAKGYASQRQAVQVSSERLEDIDFLLGRGRTLTITVKDALGNPLSGAEASLPDEESSVVPLQTHKCPHGINTVSDQNGIIILKALNSRVYTLQIEKHGYEAANVHVNEQEETANVILERK